MILLKKELKKVERYFPDTFITLDFELVVCPKLNIFFRLDNIRDISEVKMKMLAYVSRYCFGGGSKKDQRSILRRLNSYLGTDFGVEQFVIIYDKFKPFRDGAMYSKFFDFAANYEFAILDLPF